MIERHLSKTLLVSQSKKFIFIHNPKVAGTSVRTILSEFQSESYRYWSNLLWLTLPTLRDKTRFSLSKHADYKTIIDASGSQFEDYTVFGFVRNPWDVEVSRYEYISQSNKHFQHETIKEMESFSHYLNWRKNNFKTQSSYFQNKSGKIEGVNILKIENSIDVNSFLSNLIGYHVNLPRKNSSRRTSYKDYYTNKLDIEMVRSIYGEDINRFEYTF